MAQGHGDPDEIRAFARVLATFCQETRDQLQRVGAQLVDMGHGSWSDQKYREFVEQFGLSSGALRSALDDIESPHVQTLEGHARRLEDYLRG
jgi:hypothetical protein